MYVKIENCTFSRNLIIHRRPGRALKQMEFLPNFERELQEYIFNYVQTEARGILLSKEVSAGDFSRKHMDDFTYDFYHAEVLANYPILSAVITGAVSNQGFEKHQNPSRKGFGGSRRDEDISLKPVICQTVARLLHNKHPRSASLLQCMNSALNTVQHLPVKAVTLSNALGDSFR